MKSEFILSIADQSQIPKLFKGKFFNGLAEPRIAFVGRSNVGKSSLINALLLGPMARVSQTPGKTATVNFFTWPDYGRILVDLPGYGFAKASQTDRKKWIRFIEGYLEADGGLEAVAWLLDARHGPTPQDLEALEYLQGGPAKILPVFTKEDQLKSQSDRAKRHREAQAALAELGCENPFWFSTETPDTRHRARVLSKILCGVEQ